MAEPSATFPKQGLTPAPWTIEIRRSKGEDIRIVAYPGRLSVGTATDNQYVDGLSNAKLLSAAPELLDACKALLLTLAQYEPWKGDEERKGAEALALAAIAKAGGGL